VFRFDPRHWLEDIPVQVMSSASRGIYVNLLCRARGAERRGELSGQLIELAKSLICTTGELDRFFLEARALELVELVHGHDGRITLIDKRMAREEKAREKNRLRQARFRSRQAREKRNGLKLNAPIGRKSA